MNIIHPIPFFTLLILGECVESFSVIDDGCIDTIRGRHISKGSTLPFKFGSINCSLETMRLVWGPENHLFSIGAVNHSLLPLFQATHVFQCPDRMNWGKLLHLPVTCIIIQDMLPSSPASSPSWFTDLCVNVQTIFIIEFYNVYR